MARGAALLLAILLLLVGCGTTDEPPVQGITTSDDDGYHGVLLDQPYDVPRVRLTDTAGRPFDLAAQPRRTLVFFGYTNCPDICQVVMSTIASALVRLPQGMREQVQVAFVTTDPARDTRSALRTYLDRFNPQFTGVTGPLNHIERLGKAMKVFIKKGRRLPSGGYEVDHSTAVLSVDHGSGDLVWTSGTSPAEMAADLEKQLR